VVSAHASLTAVVAAVDEGTKKNVNQDPYLKIFMH